MSLALGSPPMLRAWSPASSLLGSTELVSPNEWYSSYCSWHLRTQSLPGWTAVFSLHLNPHRFSLSPLDPQGAQELRLLENKSPEGYLPIRNFWLFFGTKCKFISHWISPPSAWAGDWPGCSPQSVVKCYGLVPESRHLCWSVCHTPLCKLGRQSHSPIGRK